MKNLSPQQFEKARRFLLNGARPLERTLFCFHFENGSEEAVADALSAFRNPDGGFGRALEPDVRTPSSSALATALALRILAETEPDEEEDLVPPAIEYLLRTLDRKALTWRAVPDDVNDHPHAPWWHDEDGSLAKTFDQFRIIPRVLLMAMLHHYAAQVPAKMLRSLTDAVIETISGVDVLGTGGGSDLEYVLILAQVPGLPNSARDLLVERLRHAVPSVVVRDPAKWNGYCITPLRAAPTPTSVGADAIRDLTETHIDWILGRQTEEGTWNPTWSWSGGYPEAWAEAEREWKGILTLEVLLSLRAYGRIDFL
jgi:hypothetical protein